MAQTKNIMNTALKIFASSLLLFNGLGAIYGGGNLIAHPDGSSISLSMDWLKHTPFHSYLIPGIILFIVNGVFSLEVVALILADNKNYRLYITIQGGILTGWIFVQVLMIRTIDPLHYIMAITGLLLLFCGTALVKINKSEKSDKEHFLA